MIGRPSVIRARRVLDRFAAADGGLLAAGIAYNATLALIPLAVLVAAIGGFVLTDADSQRRFIDVIVTLAPPLKGVVDEIVRGLSSASTPLSVIGLVLAVWGTSRLYASVESAVGMMFVATGRRGFVSRTVRRIGSVVVLSTLVSAALVVVPALSVAGDLVRTVGPLEGSALTVGFVALAMLLAAGAVAALFRWLPPVIVPWAIVRRPALVVAIALLGITRAFTLLAPRLFGANAVYGTLGAIFLGLAWLDLVFVAILLGAAWVADRVLEPRMAAE
ncbi:MAG TPA: YihY/virulence factor BrkB family protein [Candidatus Limnocylindrales bacterium]|nr:YihY/virulence factor BrkB family protein [Candidatus Limnocylindrales bacterium]